MVNSSTRCKSIVRSCVSWLWAIACLLLMLGVWLLPTPAWAQALPLTNAQTPDWSQISFSQFPPVASSGSVPTQGSFPGRRWLAGQTPDQFLALGDVQELQPQAFSLNQIGQVLGQNLAQTSLSAFPLATKQSLKQLLDAIPSLGQLQIKDIPPIAALVGARATGIVADQGLATGLTFAQAIQQFPKLGALKLDAVDLTQFAITSIPGLADATLGNFSDWETTPINDVSGLNQVPLTSYPNPLASGNGIVMRVDAVYGPSEANRTNTISGSDRQGFAVPCTKQKGRKDCAYIELDDLEASGRSARGALEGKQWLSGKYQEVEGGKGALRAVNGDKEPTGRLPFGPTFKVAVWEPDETTDTVTTALFFRFCQGTLGCTPYFIGPVPFLTYKVNALMLVGDLVSSAKSATAPSTPTGASRGKSGSKYGELPDTANCLLSGQGVGDRTGLDLKSLAKAIASIESQGNGDYQAVGVHTCADGGSHCGRGLGRYQFMNYNPFAATLIAAKPDGQAFLDRVQGGYQPTAADLMQYFPPEDQERAFQSALADLTKRAKQQLDPTTGRPFTGTRLIERVAQMHFGGPDSAIDGGSSDALGQLSLRDYGRQAAQRYQASANVCAPFTKANTGKGQPASAAKGLGNQIAIAANNAAGMDTSVGPGSGNEACAWAVNRVLQKAGVAPLGDNPNYVPSVEAALRNGRGQAVSSAQAQAGDIIIAKDQRHIGICLNEGCTQVRSNSSSRAQFAWVSSRSFDGYYDQYGGSEKLYRVIR